MNNKGTKVIQGHYKGIFIGRFGQISSVPK